MDRYINADKMLEEYKHSIYDTTDLAEMLNYMPAADVQEVKHGRWVDLHCSVCGKIGWMDEDNYCPNCGAKMDEVDNET